MPVAVAGLLTFLLDPVVRLFERRLSRVVAVMLVVVLTFSILGALAWALALQASSLGEEIPTYRDNLKQKIAAIRGASRGTVIQKIRPWSSRTRARSPQYPSTRVCVVVSASGSWYTGFPAGSSKADSQPLRLP